MKKLLLTFWCCLLAIGAFAAAGDTYVMVNSSSDLNEGDVVVVAADNGSQWYTLSYGTSFGTQTLSGVSGNVLTEAEGANLALLTVVKTGVASGYDFALKTSDNKYVGNSSSSAGTKTNNSIVTGFSLKYSTTATNNRALECNNSNSQKYLSFNAPNLKFYANSSSYKPARIFKKQQAPSNDPAINVDATLKLGMGINEAPAAKTLVVTGSNLENAITASWKTGGIFSATGELTAEGGELTISLIKSDGGNYADNLILTCGELSETVAVSASIFSTDDYPSYVFVSEYSGDYVAMTNEANDNKSLKHKNITKYVKEGAVVLEEEDPSIVWYVNSAQGYIFFVDGDGFKYLSGSTGSAADLKISNEPYVWTWDSENGYWYITDTNSTKRAPMYFQTEIFKNYATINYPKTSGYGSPAKPLAWSVQPVAASIADLKAMEEGTVVNLIVDGAKVTNVSGPGAVVELYNDGEYAGALYVAAAEIEIDGEKGLSDMPLARGNELSGTLTGTLATNPDLGGIYSLNVNFNELPAATDTWQQTTPQTPFAGTELTFAKALEEDNYLRLVKIVSFEAFESYDSYIYLLDENSDELYAICEDVDAILPNVTITSLTGIMTPMGKDGNFTPMLMLRDAADAVGTYAVEGIATLKAIPEGAEVTLSVLDAKVTAEFMGLLIVEDDTESAVGLSINETPISAGSKISGDLKGFYSTESGYPVFVAEFVGDEKDRHIEEGCDVSCGAMVTPEEAFNPDNFFRLFTFKIGNGNIDLAVDETGMAIIINDVYMAVDPTQTLEFENPVKSVTGILATLPSAGAFDENGSAAEGLMLFVRSEADVIRLLPNSGNGDINVEDWAKTGEETTFNVTANYQLQHKVNDDALTVVVEFKGDLPEGFDPYIVIIEDGVKTPHTLIRHLDTDFWTRNLTKAPSAAQSPARAAAANTWSGANDFNFKVLCNYAGGTAESPEFAFSSENYTSGIDTIETAAEAVYYNLQGLRVDNPQRGSILIRVCGDSVTKVLVK